MGACGGSRIGDGTGTGPDLGNALAVRKAKPAEQPVTRIGIRKVACQLVAGMFYTSPRTSLVPV